MNLEERSDQELQREAIAVQYHLRSLFLARSLKKFLDFPRLVQQLNPVAYSWEGHETFGISSQAWIHITANQIAPHLIFCHPCVIQDNPKLIAYYRSLAAIPQKAIAKLAFGTADLEKGQERPLTESRAVQLANVLNRHISTIIEADPEFSSDEIVPLFFASVGSQLNGSWRNQIDREGTRQVKKLLIQGFLDQGLVRSFVRKDSVVLDPVAEWAVDDVKGFVVRNGYRVFFGLEPDISILNPEGEEPTDLLVGVVEVKCGLDPAGALERYGAAKKSFDEAFRRNKSVETIYLASCITETVERRIAEDRSVRKTFNLTKVFFDPEEKHRFLNHIRWILHL